VRGELATHRRGSFAGESSTILVKLVAWLLRNGEKKQERDGTLRVRTDADSLLIAVNQKGERIWNYHCDHVRRWANAYARQLQRWQDDAHTENQPSQYEERREAATRNTATGCTPVVMKCLPGWSATRVGGVLPRSSTTIRRVRSARSFPMPHFGK
jgi:hypothetical protein